ncbi:hypothetical protein ACWFNE_03070 [Cellulomonas sp. NPDC055163]
MAQQRPTARSTTGRVRWVAVDANVYGQGAIRLARLETFASSLLALDVVVLVHECVLWEWAQHAHESYTSARSTMRRLKGDLDGARVEKFSQIALPRKTVREFVDHLIAELDAIQNVVVVPSTFDGMRTGLRAQVLLEAPGKRKGGDEKGKGTKTGASDIAATYDVVAYVLANSTDDGLAIVSADRDIPAALKHLGIDWVEQFKNEGAALEALQGLEMHPLEHAERARVSAALTWYVVERLPDESDAAERIAALQDLVDLVADDSPAINGDVGGVRVTDVVGPARVHTVRGMSGTLAGGARYVTAHVSLVVDAAGVAANLPVGLEDLRVWQRSGLMLEVQVAALQYPDGVLRDVRPIGPGVLHDAPRDPLTLEEAKSELASALGRSTVFGDESWWHDVFTDVVPDDVPVGFDWYREDYLDTDSRYAIDLVINGIELPVVIEENGYLLVTDGGGPFETTADATLPVGVARELEGPPAVVAEFVRRWTLWTAPA